MPQDDVLGLDVAIPLDPFREAVRLRALGGVLPRGVALGTVELRHPEVRIGELTLPGHRALVVSEERGHRRTLRERQELVRGRLPRDRVPFPLGVRYLPAPSLAGVAHPHGVLLRLQHRLVGSERVPQGTAFRQYVHLAHRIPLAVHGHVEAGAEHVLVYLGVDTRRDEDAVGRTGRVLVPAGKVRR